MTLLRYSAAGTLRRAGLALSLGVALGTLPLLPAVAGEPAGEEPLGTLEVAFLDGPASAQRGRAIRAEAHAPDGAPVTVSVETVVAEEALADRTEVLRAELRAGLEQAVRDEIARQLLASAGGWIAPSLLEQKIDQAISWLNWAGYDLEALLDEAVADSGGQDLAAEIRAAIVAASDATAFDVDLAVADDAVGLTGTQLEGVTQATANTANGSGVASFDDAFWIGRTGRGFTLEATAEGTITVEVHATRTIAPPDLTTIGKACCVPEEGSELTAGVTDSTELDLSATSEPSARFTIWEVVEDCAGGGTCDAAALAQGFRVDVTAPQEAGALLLTPSHEDPGCTEDYMGLPQAVLFDTATGEGAKTVTITIERDVVHADVDNGRSKYDICLLTDAPFVAKDGTLVERDDEVARYDGDPLVYGPALMADCKPRVGGQDPPCVAMRRAGPGGTAVLVLHLPEGDPMFR